LRGRTHWRSGADERARLAGCDRLTIAPNLLEELAASEGPLERKLSPDRFERDEAVDMDEKRFRWEMNEDAMATEMLSGVSFPRRSGRVVKVDLFRPGDPCPRRDVG
jgi:hypothetical protein